MTPAKSFLALALLAFAAISFPAQAGCGDSKAQCFLYKKGKLVKKSACTITECANIHNYLARWDWKSGEETDVDQKVDADNPKVNGFEQDKGKLTCYGTNKHKDTLYCTDLKY